MSNAQPTPSHPRSDVRNTVGKDKQTPQGSARTTSAVDLEEFCEKHYKKLLPIMANKYEHERRKKEKLKEVKARLDFGDVRKRTTKTQESAYSESRTRSPRRHRRSHNARVLASSQDLEAEDGVCPHTSIVVRKTQGIQKNILKVKTVEGDTGSLNHKSKIPVLKMTTSLNPGSRDPEDHLKIFQAAAKTERWVMPTWCHMFNSTLTGNARVWFDDLPPESIDSYDDLREAFLKNYLQQKKCIRDPIVLHNIKQRDGESTEDFIQRYKSESGNVKGAPECMRISGFVHGITNPELIKRFHEKIPKIVDEMMQVATSFLQGQEAALNQERKKTSRHGKPGRKSQAKFIKKEKLQHQLGKTCRKKRRATRKRKTSGNLNDSAMAKGSKAEDNSKFSPDLEMNHSRLWGHEEQRPLIIEAEIGGHQVYRMCVDGGSSFEILYEHCFNRLRPEIRNQMVPATTSLVGFSGEIKWPLRQITLLVKVRDDEHSTSTWMDFMVVRSTSPYNGIIGRSGLRKMKAVPLK
ncbi:reverse transcriptase domain-containing protein [Tanacetum coccineum]